MFNTSDRGAATAPLPRQPREVSYVPVSHARLAWFERLSTEQVADREAFADVIETSPIPPTSGAFASPPWNRLPCPHRALSPAVVSGAGGGTPAAGAGTAITAGVLVAGFAVLLPALKDCAVSKCLFNVGKVSVA
jgi:hypothetical protein